MDVAIPRDLSTDKVKVPPPYETKSFSEKIAGYMVVVIFTLVVLAAVIISPTLFFLLIPTFIVYMLFWQLSPVKTEHGVAIKEHLLGLKLYLKVAEKDRLAFHNAPEKMPEVFEKLLPYAMVFGVDKAWAKEFESIYTTPPSWYEGSQTGHFSAIAFTSSLSSFSSLTSSALSSTPGGSSGSGGGGSSGGGGGGGGGGSW